MPPVPPIQEEHITYVKATCHCGLNALRAGFPTESLPISSDLCHCSSCRHSSGQMAVYHVSVVSLLCAEIDEPFHAHGLHEDGDLVAYQTSETAINYFCRVCSSHLLFQSLRKPEGEGWCVAAGALEKTEGIVQVGYHAWVEDTLDGGLAEHLRTLDGVELPRYSRAPKADTLPLGWKHPSILVNQDDELHFSCHCQAVQFKITRPNTQSDLPQAPFPDILYPHDITRLAKVRNPRDIKWWLRPADTLLPNKYLAGHCACHDCRLTSGFELSSWAYVPLANIVDNNGEPMVLRSLPDPATEYQQVMDRLAIPTSPRRTPSPAPSPRTKGLSQYIVSPGRYREFCATCGAAVFSWRLSQPDLVCVAIGLVDERQCGARAEPWFDWCLKRVGYMEQAVSNTAEALAAGLREVQNEQGSDDTSARSESPQPATSISLGLDKLDVDTWDKLRSEVQVLEAQALAAKA